MKRSLPRFAIYAIAALAHGCTGMDHTCENALSREQVIESAQEEKVRQHNLEALSSVKISIEREGCDYLYFEERIPPTPGGHLMIRINEKGEVIEYVPGI